MTTKTSIAAAFVLALTSMACNTGQEKKSESVDSTQAIPANENKPSPGEILPGKWVQPISGQDTAMQGFQLNADGTAASVNMHTLIYDKWELKGDTLLMWNHTEGVKTTGAYVDTVIIRQITDSTLVLARKDNFEMSYTRGK
ncbi:hypothetical protein EGT74_13720 [Chitinophaga lutea]|uniref:Lipocalin-like domain-containing protein n=1 Tax=Chitinophaga lutea TaxID=2488634 RepID=A0A3N4PHE1_9BACT|nr:lipocalin family protein [Chitinophaga lutea]RPE08122.1 hypothetical protein EGT74_13720 [Chitinophaga lutea]